MNELVGKIVKITLVLDRNRTFGYYSRKVKILEISNGFIKCLDFLNHVFFYSLNQIKSIDLLTEIDETVNKETLDKIVKMLKSEEYQVVKEKICELIAKNVEDERLYNLLGILYEKTGDNLKASKFFRISHYLNQSFVAPIKNLENISSLKPQQEKVYYGV